MARTHPWEVSDELWKQVEPLVPPPPSPAKGGRPRLPARQLFAAIVHVLRTGIQWNALPRELGASSTVHARFQAWARAGFFTAVWEAQPQEFDELTGIAWEWQALDGAMTNAPFGGAASGPNPTDRAKLGVQRRLLTDGAGIPLAVAIDGANRHDMKLLAATLDGIVVTRPAPDAAAPPHLCLEAGYDDAAVRAAAVRGYDARIRGRGEERAANAAQPDWRARRWVVERTHSWLNRPRRRLVRWEKKAETYLAFVQLACAHLIFSKCQVSG
jgi:putative transposase